MTNRERQNSINKKYALGKEKRGRAPWCEVCQYRISGGGCRKRIGETNSQCICATAYNRCVRSKNGK